MAEHTPGPWTVSNGHLIRVNHGGAGECICGVHRIGKYRGAGDTVPLANARLIASAPDMLDALRTIAKEQSAPTAIEAADLFQAIARLAVIKATGEAP